RRRGCFLPDLFMGWVPAFPFGAELTMEAKNDSKERQQRTAAKNDSKERQWLNPSVYVMEIPLKRAMCEPGLAGLIQVGSGFQPLRLISVVAIPLKRTMCEPRLAGFNPGR